jgi:hypothetical protein
VIEDRWLYRFTGRTAGLREAAEIAETRNDVRRKITGDIVWFGLDRGEKVYFGDSVFSGEESSAQFVFTNFKNTF